MQKLLLLPFRMRYLEPQKVDTSIDFTLSFMSFKGIVLMKRLVFSGIRQELSNIGFTDFSLMVLQGYGIENTLAAPLNYYSQMSKNYAMNYDVLPENLVTTKI